MNGNNTAAAPGVAITETDNTYLIICIVVCVLIVCSIISSVIYFLTSSSSSTQLTYGPLVTIKAQADASRFPGANGYLSPCGTTTGCGTEVTLRPDSSFNSSEPNSMLRDWAILGGTTGTVVKYGDLIEIKAQATRWPGFDGYLSPCGTATAGCGIDVTLRPDSAFNAYEPNSMLRKWQILGGIVGNAVNNGDIVEIKAQATRWGGHDGYLSPCGANTADCGVNVTLRPDSEFTKYEPNSMLRKWQISLA